MIDGTEVATPPLCACSAVVARFVGLRYEGCPHDAQGDECFGGLRIRACESASPTPRQLWGFLNNPDYQPVKKIRLSTTSRVQMVVAPELTRAG